MKYRCIKELSIDEYDEDGFATGGWFIVPVGSIWEADESPHRIIGGNDTVHLDLITGGLKKQWMEILGNTLNDYFEPVNEEEYRCIALASHAVGLDHKKPYKRHGRYFYRPYRNYYDAGPDDCKTWEAMVSLGYAKTGKKDRYSDRKYLMTDNRDKTPKPVYDDYDGKIYWLTRKGLDWLGEKLGTYIHNEN